ncbi:hypothetical protein C7M84_022373 [Penaeus vannamei]|uniref:Uncharacterized protein n=1 Tax=Penaeus vannamei TaxID=6689 RepID=A0A423U6X9_PENVA|nr:hypothetical protein C7M84_022373 [Penaeus vannamei]
MGVAVVEMTSNQTLTGKREIDWSDDIVGVVDSSFFWGYIITQVPGGLIASRFPAHRVFGTAIATSSLLNMLIPGASRLHPVAVISVRVLQGLVENGRERKNEKEKNKTIVIKPRQEFPTRPSRCAQGSASIKSEATGERGAFALRGRGKC